MHPPAQYALSVDLAAFEKCAALFPKFASLLGEEKFDAVLRELWMDDFLYYDEWGNLQVDLTPVQLIAITYAMGAFIRGGAQWDGQRAWAGRFLPENEEFK
jgi:hypothetical protein